MVKKSKTKNIFFSDRVALPKHYINLLLFLPLNQSFRTHDGPQVKILPNPGVVYPSHSLDFMLQSVMERSQAVQSDFLQVPVVTVLNLCL